MNTNDSHLLIFRFDCEQHIHLLILSSDHMILSLNSFSPIILTILSKMRSRFKSNNIIFANK